jgi:hypothetical protein
VLHDPKHMIDLYQNVREDNRRRQMLHQDIIIEAEAGVIRLGVEKEQIGQPLLGDELFKVSHVGVAGASLSDEKSTTTTVA